MKDYGTTVGPRGGVRGRDPLLPPGKGSPPPRFRPFSLRGCLSLVQGDPAAARPWIARAVATARETGQPALLSESLSLAATVENVSGEHEAGRRYLDEAEAITPALNDFPATIELVQSRAIQAIIEGDLETLKAASLVGVRISREAGDLYQLEAMLRNLAVVGLMSGDFHSAN